jgi:uridine kinase
MNSNEVSSHKDAVDFLTNRLRNSPKSTYPHIVAIAGGSGSGKTTLTRDLVENLRGNEVAVLAQDDFQLGWDFENQETSKYRWDDPENYAPEELEQALRQLRAGQSVEVPCFDLALNKRNGSKTIHPSRLIIFEGLHTLSPRFRELIDSSIYVSAPLHARFLRRIFRFMKDVDPAKGAVTVRHMANFVVDAHLQFVAPQRGLAELIVELPYNFESETVKKFCLDSSPSIARTERETQSVNLPNGVRISNYESSNGVSSLVIEWSERVVFSCEVDTTIARRVISFDWLGL